MAVAANKRSVMMLYTDSTSLESHQVRIVLAEKGISFEIKYIDPNNKPEELWEINPYGSIPTLLDRELVLYQSNIIMEYLDERFPHPPLMPVYPVARGTSRLMMHRITTDWYKLVEQIESGNSEEATSARTELRESILAIGPIFAETPYFMSEDFSLVDCVLSPLLWRLPKLGIELIGQGSREVKEYMTKVFERESFQASLTDDEREMRIR